jgi:hypothetical protein
MEDRLRCAIGYAVIGIGVAGHLVGCTPPQSWGGSSVARAAKVSGVQSIPPDVRSSDDLETLIRYGAVLHSIPNPSLEQEYTRVAHVLARNPTAADRLRMALLLSVPGTAIQDDARARSYLARVLDDHANDARSYRAFARLLLAQLDDRKQLDDALADERRQRQELQQKLDQLKAIEQDTGARIPPKPMKEH